MAVSGLSGNLFELLSSQDKKTADLFALLKPGDTLKGRIIEIIPSDNKAVINFKGYNVISQMPENFPFVKGDAISVVVSQMGEKVFMKLAPPDTQGASVKMAAPFLMSAQPAAEQAAALLSAIKVPVNEQNIYTAMKLADYQIAVTKENIETINTALTGYMAKKGVDTASLPVVFSNSGAETATPKQDSITSMLALNSKLSEAVKMLSGTKDQQVINAIKQEFSASIIKSANDINSAAKATGEIAINVKPDGVVLNVSNTTKELLTVFMEKAVSENLAGKGEVKAFINAVMSGENIPVAAKFASGAQAVFNPVKNELSLTFTGMNTAMNTVVPSQNPRISAAEARNLAARFFEPALKTQPENISFKQTAPEISFQAAKQMPDALSAIINAGKNTPSQSAAPVNAREMASLMSEFAKGLTQAADSVKIMYPDKAAELSSIAKNVSEFIKSNSAVIFGKTSQAINTNFVKTAAVFVGQTINASPLKEMFFPPSAGKIADETAAEAIPVTKFDVESAIESLVFLKSREMPLDNVKFTDLMNRYFSGDMKLNQNLETLSRAMTGFAGPAETINAYGYDTQKALQLVSEIKEALSGISVKPSDRDVMDRQIKNFIEQSGITLEARVKDIFSGKAQAYPAAATKEELLSGARQSVKSLLLNLDAEIEKIETVIQMETVKTGNKDQLHGVKEAVNSLKDSVKDTLTNLNALQFINQKPASYEMLYTQIPLLMDNRLFGGELQVWYKKGSLKENLEAKEPVNIMFVLNTSKLGSVKIKMTVYKNDVECTVFAESDRAKQHLTRSKNDFLKGIEGISFNMKNFMIKTEDPQGDSVSPSGDGYVNLGNINLTA